MADINHSADFNKLGERLEIKNESVLVNQDDNDKMETLKQKVARYCVNHVSRLFYKLDVYSK